MESRPDVFKSYEPHGLAGQDVVRVDGEFAVLDFAHNESKRFARFVFDLRTDSSIECLFYFGNSSLRAMHKRHGQIAVLEDFADLTRAV